MKFVEADRVKIIEVPHIEGLRIPEMLAFVGEHCEIGKYLPDYDWEKYPSRKWIWNVGISNRILLQYSLLFIGRWIQTVYWK